METWLGPFRKKAAGEAVSGRHTRKTETKTGNSRNRKTKEHTVYRAHLKSDFTEGPREPGVKEVKTKVRRYTQQERLRDVKSAVHKAVR